ncbi:MAG: hypothetical protein FD138_3463 [Planctomycetota bacterium]|nr:MAG: hypothetical protein FD138_3463 [Planctomycetota bacterium]
MTRYRCWPSRIKSGFGRRLFNACWRFQSCAEFLRPAVKIHSPSCEISTTPYIPVSGSVANSRPNELSSLICESQIRIVPSKPLVSSRLASGKKRIANRSYSCPSARTLSAKTAACSVNVLTGWPVSLFHTRPV